MNLMERVRNNRRSQKINKPEVIHVIMAQHANELNDNPNPLEVAYVQDRSGRNQ